MPSFTKAQTPADTSGTKAVYYVTGDGSRLREVDGEMMLEFPNGVRIEHGDIIATALRGRQCALHTGSPHRAGAIASTRKNTAHYFAFSSIDNGKDMEKESTR